MNPFVRRVPYTRSIDSKGYVRIWVPKDDPVFQGPKSARRFGGWPMFEHRYVMAKKLGRRLKRKETVHHKNGRRSDNRLTNLELWTGNHGSGVRRVDLIVQWLDELPRATVRRVLRNSRHAPILARPAPISGQKVSRGRRGIKTQRRAS